MANMIYCECKRHRKGCQEMRFPNHHSPDNGHFTRSGKKSANSFDSFFKSETHLVRKKTSLPNLLK